jgi:hypothetical protein
VADLQQRAVQLRAARAPISPPVVDVVAQQVRRSRRVRNLPA